MDALTALDQLAQAKVDADIQLVADMRDAMAVYTDVGQAHVAATSRWFDNVIDDSLAADAQATWEAVLDAHTALEAALTAAHDKRDQTLADAWAAVKAA